VGGVLTIGNINDLLDALHMAVNPEDRKGVIDALLRDCSAKEFAWVVRIILKDLKIGLRHERVRRLSVTLNEKPVPNHGFVALAVVCCGCSG
jgi:hypothetical protein